MTIESSTVFPRRMTVLVSRISARGKAEKVGRDAVRILRAAGWDVDVRLTDMADIPGKIAAETPGTLLGAVGGDGYLAEVASGIVSQPDKVLVPFPGGRGNDLCRSLGIGTSAVSRAEDLADLSADQVAGRIVPIDGMWVEASGAAGPKFALGILSLGIDAEANIIGNETKLRLDTFAYTWGALKAFVTYQPQQVRGTVDGEERDLSGWIASVSNSGWMGGGINLVPGSDLRDGLLEIFNVQGESRWRVLPLLAKALSRRAPESPLVNLYRSREVTIESDNPLPAMADGDLVGYTPLRVTAAPGAVRMLI